MLSGHISSSKTGKSNISYPIFLIYSMSFIATCCSYVFMIETEKSCSYVFMSKKNTMLLSNYSHLFHVSHSHLQFLCLYD